MNFIRLLPVLLSYGLLAAHFLRSGLFPLVILSFAVPMLLLVKEKWAARSIQLLLLIGGAEWIRAMFGYIELRKAIGEDWGRLAIILISVAVLTACSGLVFAGQSLKQRYKLGKKGKDV
ncbi:MAG: hypothetical protein GY790_15410 [Bacteroidetes bacterium]|nr:hypothetical protein [Bacteroidota bacterium]